MDSPRGRIVLMRVGNEPRASTVGRDARALRPLPRLHGLRDRLPVRGPVRPADRAARPQSSATRPAPRRERLFRRADLRALHPSRAAARARPAAGAAAAGSGSTAARAAARRVPELQALVALAPPVDRRAASRRLPEVTPAARRAARAGRASCRAASSGSSSATSTRRPCACSRAEGWEVHAPRAPRCCGALQLHAGVEDEALELAKATIAAYEGFDAIAVNVGRLRLGDEGLRRTCSPTTRSGPSARRRSRPRCATSTSCWPSTEPQRAAPSARRCASPTTTPATSPTPRGARAAARPAARRSPGSSWSSPPSGSCAAARPASTTSSSRRPRRELGARKAANLLATGADAIAAGEPGLRAADRARTSTGRCRSTTR